MQFPKTSLNLPTLIQWNWLNISILSNWHTDINENIANWSKFSKLVDFSKPTLFKVVSIVVPETPLHPYTNLLISCSHEKDNKLERASSLLLSQAHIRSSHRRCSVRKSVLRNFTKFTGKHMCQSLFFNKVAGLRLFYRTPLGD